MRGLLSVALFLSGVCSVQAAPFLLAPGSWVCASPQSYQEVAAKQRKVNADQTKCLHVDREALEDIMAPFVEVVERGDDMIQVTFIVEYYRRVNRKYLHRKFTRMRYTGWTGAKNLVQYTPQ